MNQLTTDLSKLALALVFIFGLFGTGYAQNSGAQDRISNKDLVKLATNAPERTNFSSEEEYSAAKQAYIAQNPSAHDRIVGKQTESGSKNETLDGFSVQEAKQIEAKNAWIKANPEEYVRRGGTLPNGKTPDLKKD